MVDYSLALMTDVYEHTMLDAALEDGTADRKCVFEVFTRHLPEGRHCGMVAGTGRILGALEHFHLDEVDLKFLADRHAISPGTIKWLENFHFSGTTRGYREGEMFFPNSSILQVEGTFGKRTLPETLILSALSYGSAMASVALHMASTAKGRPCMDMGGRRTNERVVVAAVRAAVVGGLKGTANLLIAQLYGLKAIGTVTHCFTLAHDSERDAFESQIEALGKNTTLLANTYNVGETVKTTVEVAGPKLGGVRVDSGSLAAMAQHVHNQLDALGATNTTIIVANDLDECTLAVLQTTPVDSYGVGIMLVIDPDAPIYAMVYKLAEREGTGGTTVPVMKKSKDKVTVSGRKLALRPYGCAPAGAERAISGSEEKLAGFMSEPTWKNLLVDLVDHGHIDAQWQGHNAIMAAHDYRAKVLFELPITVQDLMKGKPAIPAETQVL